jgi:hypothetical protein
MPHGIYPRFTHMLQDHKTHKTDRTYFVKLQTLLVESLAKDHYKLFMGNSIRIKVQYITFILDMARHISAQFRQEYIETGQKYCPSTSTNEIQQTNDNIINNKRKDLSPSDLETPLAKIPKSKLF